ncbi:MAG: cell division protein FtsZ [Vicingaceae bacterium]
MEFDLPKDQSSEIKVIGVGGGGSNAVNYMYNQGITGVDFIICNTDQQALDLSPVPIKVQLGTTLTEGRGAGSKPEVGKNSAVESLDEIKAILEKNTQMVFITAGMGGGTGTGAAPVIAQAARELGILTIGIVTVPFAFEGRRRRLQADQGLEEMRKYVDTLLIINNDKLREMFGNLRVSEAFAKADDILTVAAKGIAEIITVAGYVNVDFEDVRTVMQDGGTAIMGSAIAEGENRALKAVTQALSSPLLNDNDIKGANYILLNITSGTEEISMDEISEITDFIQNEAGNTAEIIWGNGTDESLGEKVSVTVIATGFGRKEIASFKFDNQPQKIIRNLDEEKEEKKSDIDNKTHTPTNTYWQAKTVQPSFEFDKEVKENTETPKEGVVKYSLDGDIITSDETETKNETDYFTENDAVDSSENKVTNTFEFEISNETEINKNKVEQNNTLEPTQPVYTNKIPDEDQIKRSQERMQKLQSLKKKYNPSLNLSELENEPAYKRKNIDLSTPIHSSESNVSRYTLSDDEEGQPKLRDDNSFLHDNVD